ncbi:MAG: four helix bundle protein [Saprospiraceae bacterium]|nr:four helix bundle protein [Saprospiraceae bacterium]
MGDFRKLQVWIKSKDLAVRIYKLTNEGKFEKDFRFKDQIRSASVSIASNIAEGDELNTNKQAVSFFYIAKGSLAELVTQLIIANEIGYITQDETNKLLEDCDYIGRMLHKLIQARTS